MRITDLMKLDETAFRALASRPERKDLIHKKLKFLAAAQSDGCDLIPPCYLIEGEPSETCNALDSFLQTAGGDWFTCQTTEGVHTVNRAALRDILMQLKESEAVIVRSFAPSDLCGQTWYTEDKKVFIEVYQGGLPGIIDAIAMPTFYVTNEEGSILSAQEKSFTSCASFDEKNGEWGIKSCPEEMIKLDDQQRNEICRMLRAINPDRLRMKVVWTIADGVLTAQDLYIPIGLGILE